MGRSGSLVRRVRASVVLWAVLAGPAAAGENLNLPPLPAPGVYGNLLIERAVRTSGLPAVGFSHWSHRLRHTCRVCHFELEFEMRLNATEITHEKNQGGKFCGACHDGRTAFSHQDADCTRCHSGDVKAGSETFARATSGLPKARFGNEINWDQAVARKLISPMQSIRDPGYTIKPFNREFDMQPAWKLVPPVSFPHEPHNRWLDCGNCHPDLFAVKRTVTEHVEMTKILAGASCGVCHLKIAFPLNECKRCHPAWEQ